MNYLSGSSMGFNLIELNPYAPRPFVFSEVALCLRDAISKAGYKCQYCVNSSGPYEWSIVLGAKEESAIFQSLNQERVILFNFEQLQSNSVLVTRNYLDFLLRYPVLDYHSKNIEFLSQGAPALEAGKHFELPIVPSTSLLFSEESKPEKYVDILFFGSSNDRRKKIIQELKDRGLRVECVAGAYAQELTPAIKRAKVILHIHFYETALIAPLRFLQPLACQIPILSEQSVATSATDWKQSGIQFVAYEDLVDRSIAFLNDPIGQHQSIELNNEFINKLNFSHSFHEALKAMAII